MSMAGLQTYKQENVLRQAVKKWSSAFYVPLSWQFTPNYQFGSLRLWGGGGKPQNTLVVYPKQPIWFVNQVKLAILSHSEPLWWENVGKVVNWAKLAVQSHFEPLQWEKIGKVVNWAKLAVQSHSEPLQWEKIGKVVNWAKLAVQSHS